jgi:formylglycine-generating enzyme required for sulfatase activity
MGQSGNLWEWVESAFDGGNNSAGESRPLRGGSFGFESDALASTARDGISPADANITVGFRVAAVPEPSALLLTLIGTLGVVIRRRR